MLHIILIDNYDSFTFNLVDYFRRQRDVQVSVFRNHVPVKELQAFGPDLLVYSPGPGVPEEAGNLLSYIRAFKGVVPQFGVCLGLQAMVVEGGGTLQNIPHPTHGRASAVEHDGRGVFAGIPSPLYAGRYHSWAAETVPAGWESSARLAGDSMVMGIRNPRFSMEAVQFHPESVLTMRDRAGEKIIANVCRMTRSAC